MPRLITARQRHDRFTRRDLSIGRNEDVRAGTDVYRCGIEARADGKRPIKVNHAARKPDLAAESAAVKLISAME